MPDTSYSSADYLNTSSVRAAVAHDYGMGGVAVTFGIRDRDGSVRVMHFADGAHSWEVVPPTMAVEKPTFTIQEEFLFALYQELGRYFQGQPDATATRADLLHERGRVDKMIDALIDLASVE